MIRYVLLFFLLQVSEVEHIPGTTLKCAVIK